MAQRIVCKNGKCYDMSISTCEEVYEDINDIIECELERAAGVRD